MVGFRGAEVVKSVVVIGALSWAVLFLLYATLISTRTWLELAVAALAALVSAGTAVLAARSFDVALRLPALRWRWLFTFPVDAGRDVGRLALSLLATVARRPRRSGWWDEMPLPDNAGVPSAVRGYGVLVVSLTPGSYVAEVEGDDSARAGARTGTLMVHRAAPQGPVERAVTR